MGKQVHKQTNNKRLVLKKGQIAILEALYGGVGLEGVGVVGWVRVLPNTPTRTRLTTFATHLLAAMPIQ